MAEKYQIADESNVDGLVDAALHIAAKRRETMNRLRAALVNSDSTEVWKYAREICGLENNEESNRAG